MYKYKYLKYKKKYTDLKIGGMRSRSNTDDDDNLYFTDDEDDIIKDDIIKDDIIEKDIIEDGTIMNQGDLNDIQYHDFLEFLTFNNLSSIFMDAYKIKVTIANESYNDVSDIPDTILQANTDVQRYCIKYGQYTLRNPYTHYEITKITHNDLIIFMIHRLFSKIGTNIKTNIPVRSKKDVKLLYNDNIFMDLFINHIIYYVKLGNTINVLTTNIRRAFTKYNLSLPLEAQSNDLYLLDLNEFSKQFFTLLIDRAREILKLYTINPYNDIDYNQKIKFTELLKSLNIVSSNNILEMIPNNMHITKLGKHSINITDNYNQLDKNYSDIWTYYHTITYLDKYYILRIHRDISISQQNDQDLIIHIIYYLFSKMDKFDIYEYDIAKYLDDKVFINIIGNFLINQAIAVTVTEIKNFFKDNRDVSEDIKKRNERLSEELWGIVDKLYEEVVRNIDRIKEQYNYRHKKGARHR